VVGLDSASQEHWPADTSESRRVLDPDRRQGEPCPRSLTRILPYATPKGAFTGTIAWGQVDLGDDDHSHLIDPEDHLAAAMLHR